MRALVLENELTSGRGGQELSLLDACRGLAARGHELVLAYRAGGDLESEYRAIGARLIRVQTYAIDRSRTLQSLRAFTRSLWAIRGERPDVIYANQYLDSLFAGAARYANGAPFVCHLRLPPPDRMCGQFRIGMSRARRFIATSVQTRRDWVAAGYPADRIDVVPNGIDLTKYAPRHDRDHIRRGLGVPADALLVTYAGRLHPAKGIETMLRAFSLMARERPIRFVVAGRPAVMPDGAGRPRDYLGELRAIAAELNVARAITWMEHSHDVAALFSASDAAVLPSLWSEPFGRVVIESMACQTPVVASRVGGIAEILTGEFASWLVEPGDAAALAARLFSVIDQRAGDPSIGPRAREHVVKKFSAARMVDGIERVLVDASGVARGPSPAAAAAARLP